MQQRFWRLQRIAWIAMALIVAAALLGLLGQNGPLARSVAGDAGSGLEVEYQRFARYIAPIDLNITIAPGPRPDGQLRFWLDGEYVEGVQVETVTPEPARVETRGNRLYFTIDAQDPAQPAHIRLFLQAESIGSLTGTVGVEGGPRTSIRTWIYP